MPEKYKFKEIKFDSKTEKMVYDFLMQTRDDKGKLVYSIDYHPLLEVETKGKLCRLFEIDFKIIHKDFPKHPVFIDIDGAFHKFLSGYGLELDKERKRFLYNKYRNYKAIQAYERFDSNPDHLTNIEQNIYDFISQMHWLDNKERLIKMCGEYINTKKMDTNITMGGATRWKDNKRSEDTI